MFSPEPAEKIRRAGAQLKLRYLPLGGIGLQNLSDYINSPLVAAVGGSWLARPEVIVRHDWNRIRENAAQAMDVVRRESSRRR